MLVISIMVDNLRIWRVVPTSKTGVQAPTFFVETTEKGREKANLEAMKIARAKSKLGDYSNWDFILTKLNVRKDKFGRYIEYHQ